MLRLVCRLLFWLKGWKIGPWNVEGKTQYVITAIPHTSNWDFVIAIAVFSKLKIPMKFTIKDSWLRFPFGLLLKPLGAIGIDRNQPKGMVDFMSDLLINTNEPLALIVTPEGTRSRVEKWKTGFYRIAQKTNLPIALGYVDYKLKQAGVSKLINPSGNMEKDFEEMELFYKTIHPKFPEKSNLS